MSVTMKDFQAEAADIAKHLTPYLHGPVLSAYIGARCATLKAANERFDAPRFFLACAAIETSYPEPSPNVGRPYFEVGPEAGTFTVCIPAVSEEEGIITLDYLDTLIYEATTARETYLRSRWDNAPVVSPV
jgi:hypothetical protein